MADNNILLLVGAALLLMMAMGGGDKESQKSSIGDRPFDDPDQMVIHDDEPWREPYYEPEKGKPKKNVASLRRGTRTSSDGPIASTIR